MTSERTGRVAGLVLAAGASTRMGANKMLLEVDGESLLRRGVRTALAGGLNPVVVVLGHDAGRARRELEALPCRIAVNPDPSRGLGTSLATGIAALPLVADAAVVVLPDMPRVTAEMIAALVARWRETGAALVLSEYGGIVAPPVVYGRRLFPELAALDGDSAGKAVIARHRAEAVTVAWPAPALLDVDAPADLQEARAEAERR
jgi:molybdenum cofactor cytidylyltransferase